VELLVQIVPEFEEFVIEEGSCKVLYLHVKKAIYGMLESVLLFYKKLSGDLIKFGFQVNPYDPCVSNKSINQAQMTVSWHVDDLKISHQDEQVVSNFISWIKQHYGKIGKGKVKRGKVHEYLGMKLHYGVEGQVSIDMILKLRVVRSQEEVLRLGTSPSRLRRPKNGTSAKRMRF
jgi:Reverse transcriptase (RNA-dependent DNA polymerase)